MMTMPPIQAPRHFPGQKPSSVRGETRGRCRNSCANEREDDLALFKQVQSRVSENFLFDSTGDIDSALSARKFQHHSDFILGLSFAVRERDHGLLSPQVEKNDYEWLLTPPETPLFPSLDDELPARLGQLGRSQTKSSSLSRSSTMEKRCGSNRSSPSPRSERPSSARLYTPPSSTKLSARASSRISTGSSSSVGSSVARGPSPVRDIHRGNSASPKFRAWKDTVPGFSTDTPPNLRTSSRCSVDSASRSSTSPSPHPRRDLFGTSSDLRPYRRPVRGTFPRNNRSSAPKQQQQRPYYKTPYSRSSDHCRTDRRKMFRPLLSGVPCAVRHVAADGDDVASKSGKFPRVAELASTGSDIHPGGTSSICSDCGVMFSIEMGAELCPDCSRREIQTLGQSPAPGERDTVTLPCGEREEPCQVEDSTEPAMPATASGDQGERRGESNERNPLPVAPAPEVYPVSSSERNPLPVSPAPEADPVSSSERNPLPVSPAPEADPVSSSERNPLPVSPAPEADPISFSERSPGESEEQGDVGPVSSSERNPGEREEQEKADPALSSDRNFPAAEGNRSRSRPKTPASPVSPESVRGEGRSPTLEEAADVILYCGSIVSGLAYEAAAIAIEREPPAGLCPLPSVNGNHANLLRLSSRGQDRKKHRPRRRCPTVLRGGSNVGGDAVVPTPDDRPIDSKRPPPLLPAKVESRCGHCTVM